MKVVAVIQARMGSTRLPGKVMMHLYGEPMLIRVVNRSLRANLVDEIIIATTQLCVDDGIQDLCNARNWRCFRGSEDDVLDRYYQTAVHHNADAVVRIGADSPFVEPGIIDQLISTFQTAPQVDYVCNFLPPRTFPHGLEAEVFTFDLLEKLWHLDQDPATREHVTAYLHRNFHRFTMRGIVNEEDLSNWRCTVDTPADLKLARKIYDYFQNDYFSWKDLTRLFANHPDWRFINTVGEQRSQRSVPPREI